MAISIFFFQSLKKILTLETPFCFIGAPAGGHFLVPRL
jgi:hypothetical protein